LTLLHRLDLLHQYYQRYLKDQYLDYLLLQFLLILTAVLPLHRAGLQYRPGLRLPQHHNQTLHYLSHLNYQQTLPRILKPYEHREEQ